MSRWTPKRQAELHRRLSARDFAIVETLDQLRVASGAQLRRMHGSGTSSRADLRSMQLALSRLVELRVLARLERDIGGVRAGSSGFLYALDVAGQRLASGCGPAGGRRLRRPWTPGLPFIAHQLAVSELYVRLREAERKHTLQLEEFWAEPLCWRRFAGLGGARSMLKPDAFLRVGLGEYEHLYFVEVDRATHSLPAVERKLTVYRRYYQTGREQERWGVFPKVLILVPNERRKAALGKLLEGQIPESRRLFQVGLFDDALTTIAEEGE